MELTLADLGLTEEEWDALSGPHDNLIRIFHSDGSTVELAAQYEGWGLTGVATSDGFALTILDGPQETVVTSPDGRVWNEQPSFGYGYSDRTVAADGTIWRTVPETEGAFSVQRGGYGQAPEPVATFEGLQPAGTLAVGPAGLIATAVPAAGGPSGGPVAGLSEGRVTKDGHELRFNEPEGGITLWDLDADAAVYEFGPEDMMSNTPPDGVRELDDDGAITVVFEDPETGADLVTFTDEELSPFFGTSAARLEALEAALEAPEQWVGWSADGTEWGWQTMTDAFGITDGEP